MRLVLGILFVAFAAVAIADQYTVDIDGTAYTVGVQGGLALEGNSVFNVKTYGAVGDSSADDTAAFLAAVSAAEASGGIVSVPPGKYLVDTAITIESGNVSIRGSGRGATEIINASSNLLVFGSSSSTALYCSVSDITLTSAAGGGHVIVADRGLAMSSFTNVNINQDNDDKSIIYCSRSATSGGLFNNRFSGGHWVHTLTATVPGVYIVGGVGSSGNVCADNIWENLRVQYSGDYFWHIECNVASVWNYSNTIRDIECEVIYGGIVRAKSVMGLNIERVYSYDAPDTTNNTLFYFSASASGPQNRGIRITSCGRAGATVFSSGTYDIHLDGNNDSFDTIIENWYSTNAAQINLGANERTIIIGGYNASAAVISGASAARTTIVGSEGGVSAGMLTVAGLTITTGSGSPEGAVTAPAGSLYLNTAGGAGTGLYVKESGTGDTGWVGK